MNLIFLITRVFIILYFNDATCLNILPLPIRYALRSSCCNSPRGSLRNVFPSDTLRNNGQRTEVSQAVYLELLELTQEKPKSPNRKLLGSTQQDSFLQIPGDNAGIKTLAESLPTGLSLVQSLQASENLSENPDQGKSTTQTLAQFLKSINSKQSTNAQKLTSGIQDGASVDLNRRTPEVTIVPGGNPNTAAALKARACAELQCLPTESQSAICACNFKTGNVASFKNECDLRKHNCRFDTEFKTIMNEICPWEYETRRDNGQKKYYDHPKYYN